MGFMNKIKNLFTEEIEEEEVSPIKKEIQVEIPSPAEENVEKEETKKEIEVSESDAIQQEEKFVFPVFFDDKDFDTLEPPKREEEPVIKRETYGGATIDISPKKEEHVFKPTPIISPIYGVLDKNYKKEDITTRKRTVTLDEYYSRPKSLSVDDIRNKAYGTLEDDLESTLVGPMGPIYEKKDELIEDNDMFEELEQEVITVPTDHEIDEFINEELLEEKEDVFEDNLVEAEMETYEQENVEENNYSELEEVEPITDYHELEEDFEEYEENMNNEDDFANNDISEEMHEEELDKDNNITEELEEKYEEESLNDSELFDLIDSMYNDGDEE